MMMMLAVLLMVVLKLVAMEAATIGETGGFHQQQMKAGGYQQHQVEDNQTNEVDDTASPPEQQTSHKSSRTTPISPSTPASDTIESTLPGTKLPKTSSQWSEANVYFQLQQQSLPSYDNIDNFTSAFQQMIYNYFATNYGTLKQQTLGSKITKASNTLQHKPSYIPRNFNNNP
ncbi:hypothetical protein HELRODRAFT_178882 [Helobdella robusta]|uniref:SEA domain-containing protein n=1 Tax=Helobdella robusta TaxID=6412 RepID=T1FDU8_HELRO|nr:hypothetical protein HELRODRAFT_178882 [Helobdella robusta]ESN95964.1 hypothetical protein HELRODRAFT_178882 [Helobdella robusta]